MCVFYVLKTIADVCSYIDWRKISGEFQVFGSRSLFDALNIELWKEKNSECSSWIKWWKSAVMSVLLTVLGWQLLYHKWWCVSSSWWNTQSFEACCRFRDARLDSVNNYFFLSCSYCTIYILHYVGFCREQFVSLSGSASRQESWRTETICWWS